jgi:hypothetical protein
MTTTLRVEALEGACVYCDAGGTQSRRAGTLSLCGEHSVMVLARIRARLSPTAERDAFRPGRDR